MTTARLGTFADLIPILDAALIHGGGTYELSTHGAAVNFRHRCYKFMKAYALTHSPSRYDALTFPKLSPDTCTVVINLKQANGVFIPAGPAREPPPVAEFAPTDALEDEAVALARKLGIGDEL